MVSAVASILNLQAQRAGGVQQSTNERFSELCLVARANCKSCCCLKPSSGAASLSPYEPNTAPSHTPPPETRPKQAADNPYLSLICSLFGGGESMAGRNMGLYSMELAPGLCRRPSL